MSPPAPFADGSKRKEIAMPIILNEKTQEFIAKYLGDLSKAILTVGFASYFFEKLPLLLRVGCGVLALAFLIISVILISNSDKGEK